MSCAGKCVSSTTADGSRQTNWWKLVAAGERNSLWTRQWVPVGGKGEDSVVVSGLGMSRTVHERDGQKIVCGEIVREARERDEIDPAGEQCSLVCKQSSGGTWRHLLAEVLTDTTHTHEVLLDAAHSSPLLPPHTPHAPIIEAHAETHFGIN